MKCQQFDEDILCIELKESITLRPYFLSPTASMPLV